MKTFSTIVCVYLLLVHASANASAQALELKGQIHIGGESRWDFLAVDGPAHRLYLSHGQQTEVIDTQSNSLVATIKGTAGVHGIAVAPDLQRGYTSNGQSNTVTVFDLATLKVHATIKVGMNPDAIVYEPQSRRIVTFNGRSHDATVIDAVSNAVVGTVAIGGKPEVAQPDGRGSIYVNVENTNELVVLQPVDLKISHRYSLSPCEKPTGLAVDDRLSFYSVCDNKLMVVTAFDGRRIGQIAIGEGADGAAWLDGFAYSSNGDDGSITVVEAGASGALKAVGSVKTAVGARTLAADAATHTLYLPTATPLPAASAERRAWMPDTLKILVVAPK